MLSFLWPWMALLLPLPIVFWFLLKPHIKKASSSEPEILFPYTERLQSAFTTKSTNTKAKSNFWFVISLSLLWVFLVLSIMRPELIDTSNQTNRKGYDIMMAVDISLSMNLLDFSTKEKKVTRLDVVKEVVSNFIKTRHGDRLGLILFGEHAYLQVPMTLDTFAMLRMLNNSIAGMARPSTAIGDAIGIAIAELRRRTSESKVFILLTDGTDNSSNLPPLEAAQIAEKYGIRIYTIGVGSDNTMSHSMGNTNLDQGVNEVMLQKIADITGGKYFRAKDDYSLEKIYNKINDLEKIDLTITEYRSKSLHKYPLLVACFLFLVLCLMPLYRRFLYGI